MGREAKIGFSMLLRRDVLCFLLGCSLGVNITVFFFMINKTQIKTEIIYPKTEKPLVRYLCPFFRGGLGNNMFQYASVYGIAKTKGMDVAIYKSDFLWNVFHLNVSPIDDKSICESAYRHNEGRDCAYDRSALEFMSNQNVILMSHLQSWKYFSNIELEIRRQFTFNQETINSVAALFRKAVGNSIYSNIQSSVTTIGLHVRRGDYLLKDKIQFGYQTAPKEYFDAAMQYYRERYKFPLFFVVTNPKDEDMTWCSSNIKGNDVIYMFGNSRIIDMCVLSKCSHTIMSVGTFGWWGAWLANGTTVYYKNFVIPGSSLSQEFSSPTGTPDFFYPNWIGL